MLVVACRKKSVNCEVDCGTQTKEQLFQTGFNGTVLTNGEYQNVLLSGMDPDFVTLNSWSVFQEDTKIGYTEISYEDGDDSQRKASIVDDPDSVGNKVLKFQIFEPFIKEGSNYKGRVQLAVHDNKCIKEIYQMVKVKLSPDLAHFTQRSDRLYWFTLFEFWNNAAWSKEKHTFRISVNLNKEEGVGSPINFRVKSDLQKCRTCNWKEEWGKIATSYPIVFGQWMEIELYLKEGDRENGRFYMSVTPENGTKQVLFDIHNITQHPKENCADGFTHFEALKLYLGEDDINYMKNANKELAVFWDDWQFWVNLQP
jgi:hypothetical protein